MKMGKKKKERGRNNYDKKLRGKINIAIIFYNSNV